MAVAAIENVWLVCDLSDPLDRSYTKLTAARHSSLEGAISQAEVDVDGGRTVVGIFDAPLNAAREPEGKRLWPE
jgi:hypothetical protein